MVGQVQVPGKESSASPFRPTGRGVGLNGADLKLQWQFGSARRLTQRALVQYESLGKILDRCLIEDVLASQKRVAKNDVETQLRRRLGVRLGQFGPVEY